MAGNKEWLATKNGWQQRAAGKVLLPSKSACVFSWLELQALYSLFNLILTPLTVLTSSDVWDMMSGRIIKEVAHGAKRVSIILAEEVQDKGFKRAIDAIDPALVAETAEKVANAFSGSTMMTESQKAQADKIIITYDTAQSEASKLTY
jgi:hypothetical protein